MNITTEQKIILLEHLHFSLEHLTNDFKEDLEMYREDIDLLYSLRSK